MRRTCFVIGLCLLLAGCGGGDKSTDPTDPSETDPTDPIDPADYQLSGLITFDGASITNVTTTAAYFWIRDESTGQSVDSPITVYDHTTGRYGINGVPNGPIGVSVTFHVTGAEETHPGNYRAWKTLDLSKITKEEAADYRIPVSKVIHLLEPFDNTGYQSFESYPSHDSPLTFQWEPIDGAARYEVGIEQYGDDPYSYIAKVHSSSVTTTSVTVSLPQSGNQTHYEFEVYAYTSGGDVIGYYMTTYDGGYGWDYRFTIQ